MDAQSEGMRDSYGPMWGPGDHVQVPPPQKHLCGICGTELVRVQKASGGAQVGFCSDCKDWIIIPTERTRKIIKRINNRLYKANAETVEFYDYLIRHGAELKQYFALHEFFCQKWKDDLE